MRDVARKFRMIRSSNVLMFHQAFATGGCHPGPPRICSVGSQCAAQLDGPDWLWLIQNPFRFEPCNLAIVILVFSEIAPQRVGDGFGAQLNHTSASQAFLPSRCFGHAGFS